MPPPNDRNDDNEWEPTNHELVPMMYRAQVQGRCSLQYGREQPGFKPMD
jgi:hypothetical protein